MKYDQALYDKARATLTKFLESLKDKRDLAPGILAMLKEWMLDDDEVITLIHKLTKVILETEQDSTYSDIKKYKNDDEIWNALTDLEKKIRKA